jgi:hypothetical protein
MATALGNINTGTAIYTEAEVDSIVDNLFSQTANGSISGTTTETTLIGAGSGSLTIGANTLQAGDVIKIRMRGFYTDTTGTRTYRSKLAGTTQATSAINPANATNGSFEISILITIRTIGAGGTAIAQGKVTHYDSGGTQTGVTSSFTPQTATFSIDTTVANVYDLTCQFSAVGATNSATSTNFTIQKIKSA